MSAISFCRPSSSRRRSASLVSSWSESRSAAARGGYAAPLGPGHHRGVQRVQRTAHPPVQPDDEEPGGADIQRQEQQPHPPGRLVGRLVFPRAPETGEEERGQRPAVAGGEVAAAQIVALRLFSGEVFVFALGIACPPIAQTAGEHPIITVQQHGVARGGPFGVCGRPRDQVADGAVFLRLHGADVRAVAVAAHAGQLAGRERDGGAAVGAVQRPALRVDDGQRPVPGQIPGQRAVVAGDETRVRGERVPVGFGVDAVQPRAPQQIYEPGDQQQHQGEQQIAAGQQRKKPAAFPVIFQFCSPILSR